MVRQETQSLSVPGHGTNCDATECMSVATQEKK